MARILYFSRDYTPHDHRFLTALAQTRHQVFYLRLEKSVYCLEKRSLPPNISVIAWAGGEKPVRLRQGLKLLSSLKRVIRETSPDLIHAGPLQSVAFLVSLTGFQPLVSASWGYDLLKDAPKNPLSKWVTRYVLRHSAVMIGDCRPIRQAAISYGMPDERIVTFPWGVDLQRFSPSTETDKSARRETFTLLSTRGWEEIYGVEVIAQAFVRASRELPYLRLIMLSEGSKVNAIRNILRQGGGLEKVTFPGPVSQDDLPGYYQKADVYVSASHSDGTSISLLEALACGKPAILSDIPGNREWITSGIQGWLFPDGDSDALANTILQAAKTPDALARMGKAARQLAEQRADWSKNFRELLYAYTLALRAPKSNKLSDFHYV